MRIPPVIPICLLAAAFAPSPAHAAPADDASEPGAAPPLVPVTPGDRKEEPGDGPADTGEWPELVLREPPPAPRPSYPRTVVRDGRRCLQFLDPAGEVRERCEAEKATRVLGPAASLTRGAQPEAGGPIGAPYGAHGGLEAGVRFFAGWGSDRAKSGELELEAQNATILAGWWAADGLLLPVGVTLEYAQSTRSLVDPRADAVRDHGGIVRLGVHPLWLWGAPVPMQARPGSMLVRLRPFVQGHASVAALGDGFQPELGLSAGVRLPAGPRLGFDAGVTALRRLSERVPDDFGAQTVWGFGVTVFHRQEAP